MHSHGSRCIAAGVGEYLLQLSGLLRPLTQRHWAATVAQSNRLEDSQLEMFLFGADRTTDGEGDVRPRV